MDVHAMTIDFAWPTHAQRVAYAFCSLTIRLQLPCVKQTGSDPPRGRVPHVLPTRECAGMPIFLDVTLHLMISCGEQVAMLVDLS